jgi:hypothetical protein
MKAADVKVGQRVKIGPAYSMETRRQTIVDDVTGLHGFVDEVHGQDASVETDTGRGYWVNVRRLEEVPPCSR